MSIQPLSLLLKTDSYKHSHYLQYPEGTTRVHSYIEARSGKYSDIRFFGLQAFIKKYLLQPVTMEQVERAKEVAEWHGVPFNYAGWKHIVQHHKGKLPIVIRAVPEGSVVPIRNVLVTVENTDPKCAWLTSFIETGLLRGVWYPSTVATTSFRIKKLIANYLEKTGTPSLLPFKLHDFGARGVSSDESAQVGGMAHLTNFLATDTMSALIAAHKYYHMPRAGFSVPAAEHSTMTALGSAGETRQFRRMIETFGGEGKNYVMVCDSYNIYEAVKTIGTELKDLIIAKGGTLHVRPDSGDPVEVIAELVIQLDKYFGSTVNEKGFKVLHPAVRVIQGDGVNEESIGAILARLAAKGYSADNVGFGMGGALLQGVNRDTCSWAMKCSAIEIDGKWNEVFKAPITDSGKSSRKGRVELVKEGDKYKTVRVGEHPNSQTVLREVFRDGHLLVDDTLEDIRARGQFLPLRSKL